MLGWLQSVFSHAAAIGRFCYSLAKDRGSLNLTFADWSLAAVTRTGVWVERDAENGKMASCFAVAYLGTGEIERTIETEEPDTCPRNLSHEDEHSYRSDLDPEDVGISSPDPFD